MIYNVRIVNLADFDQYVIQGDTGEKTMSWSMVGNFNKKKHAVICLVETMYSDVNMCQSNHVCTPLLNCRVVQ